MTDSFPYWSSESETLLGEIGSSINGLSEEEATERRKRSRSARPPSPIKEDLLLLVGQFKSPLQLILIVAIILSLALGDFSDSGIILSIVLLSGLLGFWQERKAGRALQRLRAMVMVRATVLRSGKEVDVPLGEVVPGDVVQLNAGDIIPGDAVLLEARDLHVNESALTGESFPAEKKVGALPVETPLSKRMNCLFQGTSVVNGTARALVIRTGGLTEFGKVSAALQKHQPLTAFEEGVKKFGFMIMRISLFLSLFILIVDVFMGKPVTESILFALALAVGMAPELLPAIVTITLSAGATRMAARKVIVKKLASIQNLGAVEIFCSDKTGTLTEGVVRVQDTVDGRGKKSDTVRTYAFLNATFETGFTNPLDEAIRNLEGVSREGYEKADEVPYDFIRKRLSIVVSHDGRHLLITKGAVANVLEVCEEASFGEGANEPLDKVKEEILGTHRRFSAEGFRTIGVCYKDITGDPVISKDDESKMIFLGFVVLSDSLKQGIADAIAGLKRSGVQVKVITGDNQLVAAHACSQIGLRSDNLLTGSDLKLISDEALPVRIRDVDVFAETEPNQKERLVMAFRRSGKVVGYMGDGINDVSALRAADVSISVDTAVDVAKETADMVFLEKDLNVLHEGIIEGRKTFANTLKYIFITTSANFGNMFSMAGTSLFLPFLPLLPKQILLLNLLSDVPAMAISSDKVDEEQLVKARKWDSGLIQKFMVVFGIESSLFDFITFGVLLFVFHADKSLFQTGWFLESLVTELLILLVIRTQRPFLKSRPGKFLSIAVVCVTVVTLVLPYSPVGPSLGLTPLSGTMIVGMTAIAVTYTLAAEFTKRYFFKKIAW